MSTRTALLLGSLATALAIACSAPGEDTASSTDAIGAWTPHRPVDPSTCSTPAAGRLTLFLIPPSTHLDWSTPNRLIGDAIRSEFSEKALKNDGKVAIGHSIGHVNVELDCGDYSVPLTGQTGGNSEWKSGLDGFGMLLRPFEGSMNGFPGEGRDAMIEDIRLRQENGLLARMSFLVNENTCKRVKTFHDEYVRRKAYARYGGIWRSRRFEGGGCAIWGADVVDVSGVLRRSQFAPIWTQSMMVGEARFANVLGSDHYVSGSNMVARGPDGKSLIWPHGLDIPTSGWPIFPGTPRLDSWTGESDDSFEVKQLENGPMDKAIPFSIFDPMLMHDWAQKVWSDAKAHGSAHALEADWKANTVGAAHEITTDARCTPAQTIPFEKDNDDLFKDSDQP